MDLRESFRFSLWTMYKTGMIQDGMLGEIKALHDTGLFETLANSLPALVWVSDASGACVWFNRQWLDFTGRTLAQESGDGWIDSVHPDDRAHCVETYRRNLAARQVSEVEYRLRHHSGDYRWIIDRGGPRFAPDGAFLGFTGACSDISDRKTIADDLHLTLDRYNLAIAATSDGIWDWDIIADTTYYSPRCKEMLGFRDDEIAGTREAFMRRLHPDDRSRAATGRQPYILGETPTYRGTYRLQHKNGEWRTILSRGEARRDPDGRVRRMSGTLTDITDQMRLENDLRQLNETLEQKVAERTRELADQQAGLIAAQAELRRHRDNLQELIIEQTRDLIAAKEQAEAANQAKSEFLANMSHEIRTPMNAVIGLAHLLEYSRPLTDKQGEFIRTLRGSAAGLMDLINDLLDIAKIEAHHVDLEAIPFELAVLLNEVRGVVEGTARDKGLNFTVDGDIDQHLVGDPAKLRQILVNLCSNAVKFTDTGGVRITVTTPVEMDSAMLQLRVSDTGIGIPADKLDSIFDKFSQGDSSTSRKYGGTGLGLAITRGLTELMGGSVTVSSLAGTGSAFVVRVPLRRADPVLPQNTSPQAEASPLPVAVQNLGHILLVEDNPGNVIVATHFLEEMGYGYDVADSGGEALERIAAGTTYTAVLMDVQMPGMDGLEATRRIRERERQAGMPRLPVIALTAHALTGDRERCLAAGMDDYLSKPFDPARLAAVLATVVTRLDDPEQV